MNFIHKLNNTHELLNKLDDIIIRNTEKKIKLKQIEKKIPNENFKIVK